MGKKNESVVGVDVQPTGDTWVAFAPDGKVLWSYTVEDGEKVKAADAALYAAMSGVAHNRPDADALRAKVETILNKGENE